LPRFTPLPVGAASSLWHWSSPYGGRALPATLRCGARTFLTRTGEPARARRSEGILIQTGRAIQASPPGSVEYRRHPTLPGKPARQAKPYRSTGRRRVGTPRRMRPESRPFCRPINRVWYLYCTVRSHQISSPRLKARGYRARGTWAPIFWLLKYNIVQDAIRFLPNGFTFF
jgi:hypothetical protein